MASCPVSTPAESQASLPFVHGTGSLGVYRPGDCPISIGINACQRRVCFHLFVARPRSLNLQPFWRPRCDLNSGIHRRTKGSLRLQVISRQRETLQHLLHPCSLLQLMLLCVCERLCDPCGAASSHILWPTARPMPLYYIEQPKRL